jgi:hypothetical protein
LARAVTDLGGKLEVIIPAARYRAGLPAEARPEYDRLLAEAAAVRSMPFTESTSQARMEASKAMINQADELLAVRDGQPAATVEPPTWWPTPASTARRYV